MFTRFYTLLALITILGAPAYAKITVFSNSEALDRLINSKELDKEAGNLGELTGVSIEQSIQDEEQEFTFRLTYTVRSPIGKRNCFVGAIVEVEKFQKQGVTGSRLGKPSVGQASCQKG